MILGMLLPKAAIRLPCSALLRCYRRQTIIGPSLTNLFNLSIRTGIFPKGLEISKSDTYIQR